LFAKSIDKNYLESERIQFYLRITIISLVILNLIYLQYFSTNSFLKEHAKEIALYPYLAFVISLMHFYFISHYPYLYQKQRIMIMGLFDVCATVAVMYLAGELAVYYSALLLWFVIGYGMRYGVKIGYFIYLNVLIFWSLLLYFSDFWHQHLDMGFGWLIAYFIIPLYFFKLVNALQTNIYKLHQEVDNSNYKALHDPLTSLPNRVYFNKKLGFYMNEFHKKKQKFALIFIDLDYFKMINDSFGHEVGDNVLVEVSKRISLLDGFITRLGGGMSLWL